MRATVPLATIVSALALAACAGDGGESQATAPTATTAPEVTTTIYEITTVTEPTPELPDGRHFGYLVAVRLTDVPPEVVFDLAELLTGDEANEAAGERGFETPVPNDYFVVNDNPRVRTLRIAPTLVLDLVDWKRCCERRFTGDPERFEQAFEAGNPPAGRYRGSFTAYRLTVAGGLITRIEEVYLP